MAIRIHSGCRTIGKGCGVQLGIGGKSTFKRASNPDGLFALRRGCPGPCQPFTISSKSSVPGKEYSSVNRAFFFFFFPVPAEDSNGYLQYKGPRKSVDWKWFSLSSSWAFIMDNTVRAGKSLDHFRKKCAFPSRSFGSGLRKGKVARPYIPNACPIPDGTYYSLKT